MSGALATLKEWINPAWGHHRTVPPQDAGLRLNLRLDEQTRELLTESGYAPDDVAVAADGTTLFSSGTAVYALTSAGPQRVIDLGGRVGALAVGPRGTLAAVAGRGLVWISPGGATSDCSTDALVQQGITDLTVAPDGVVFAAVGSRTTAPEDWARALVTDERSGEIVRIADGAAEVVARGLAWPSGIAVVDAGVVIATSLDHRIERRPLDRLDAPGTALCANLPVYPGRIASAGSDFWVAAPYVRNRVTEMLLDEPRLISEMMETINQDEWFVPRLRPVSPFTDTMQMGQLRVLGVVKSWAPARSAGMVFRIDGGGRVIESAHARVDSPRHGITGVAVRDGALVLAAQGYRNVLELPL